MGIGGRVLSGRNSRKGRITQESLKERKALKRGDPCLQRNKKKGKKSLKKFPIPPWGKESSILMKALGKNRTDKPQPSKRRREGRGGDVIFKSKRGENRDSVLKKV